jgi:hypothetical protein
MYLRGISYFAFSVEQRTGIVILFTIIIILQSVYFFVDFNTTQPVSPNKQNGLLMQSKID